MTAPDDRSDQPIGLYDGIITTRAMRRLSDEPIHRSELEAILRAAQQGPSGGNIQPWQFVVVTDPTVRSDLGEIYRQAYERYEAALLASMPPHRDEAAAASWERTLAASRHLADHIGAAPAIIVVLMPDIDMTLTDDEGTLDVGTPYASVYPAVQNLLLAARSHGDRWSADDGAPGPPGRGPVPARGPRSVPDRGPRPARPSHRALRHRPAPSGRVGDALGPLRRTGVVRTAAARRSSR